MCYRSITPKNVDFHKIYSFTDVKEFTLNSKVNRAVVNSNVKKFYNLMKKGKFDPMLGVIVVDIKTGTIIDGQHRVTAFKKAKEEFAYDGFLLVRFVQAPEGVRELQDYIRQFQEGRKWQLEDYISANIAGKNDLEKLRTFCLTHQNLNKGNDEDVFWRKGACIIAKTGSSEYKKRLKDRNMRFTPEEWADAERSYNEAITLMDSIGRAWTDGGFEYIMNAWKKVRYDMVLLEKICVLPNKWDSLFDYMRNRNDKPSGQQEGVWYNFFVDSINKAA
ncbi:MAG: hypothetical protein J6S67_17605 [Methanobrevibacter sp.]|nr:hypothetical protein [Methanobrevibacter sp.]